MLLLLAAACALVVVDAIVCTPNICDQVRCDTTVTEDKCCGDFRPNGGFCGCCPLCVTIIRKILFFQILRRHLFGKEIATNLIVCTCSQLLVETAFYLTVYHQVESVLKAQHASMEHASQWSSSTIEIKFSSRY